MTSMTRILGGLYLTIFFPLVVEADVILVSDGVLAFSGVTPNTIEDQPDVGDTNIYIGRVNIINGFIISPLNGELIVNAEPGPTDVRTTGSILVGAQAPSEGILTIEGNGARGSATVTAGNSVVVGGTAGFLTNNIGRTGFGIVDISNGGTLDSGALTIGGNGFGVTDSNGSDQLDGIVTVDGSTSELTSTFIGLGDATTGTSGSLVVTNGSSVSARNEVVLNPTQSILLGSVDIRENSNVSVYGQGSNLSTDGLIVGSGFSFTEGDPDPENAPGRLSIGNGGQVVVGDRADTFPGVRRTSDIGHGGRGEVEISGTGSQLTVGSLAAQTHDLYIGSSDIPFDPDSEELTFIPGEGSVLVTNQGRLLVRDDIYVGGDQSTRGNGSDDPFVAPFSSGILEVNDQAVVEAQNIFIEQGGTVRGTDGILASNVILDGGTLAPGLSPGTLTIDGDLDLLSGLLELEWYSPTSFDFLDVSGTVTFGADLFIDLLFDSEPLGNVDLFDFISATQIQFDDFDFQSQFDVSFAPGLNSFAQVSFMGETRKFASPTAVPEPGTLILFGIGLLGLRIVKRSKLASK